jgi:glycerol transport system ATP-binding protein
LEIGAMMDVFLDPKHVYIFAEDGTSVAPASYATAA